MTKRLIKAFRFFSACLVLVVLIMNDNNLNAKEVSWQMFLKSPNSSQFIDVDGIRTHYIEVGSGKPLLFIHGLGAWSYSWRKNLQYFADKGYKAIALDLKGFGLSGKPEPIDKDDYTVADQALFVKRFMEALWIDKAHIIGNSMGGGIALFMAFLCPEKVDKLVIVDPICYKQQFPFLLWVAKAPLLGWLTEPFMGRMSVSMVLRQVYFDSSKLDKKTIKAYAIPLSMNGGKKAFRTSTARLVPRNYEEVVSAYKQIKLPTLIVWGKGDAWVKPELGKRLKGDILGSKLILLDQCGHMPMEECAEGFNSIVGSFLTP